MGILDNILTQEMVNSFHLPDFRPLPFLGNAHIQTILANIFPRAYKAPRAKQAVIPLPDGDSLVAHDSQPQGWKAGDPDVLLVHGLGGCHQSSYMIRFTRLLVPQGFRVLRMDLRGAGAGAGLARRTYNAACSADVRMVAHWLHAQAPSSPLALVGMSLGGNIVLKLAGEAAEHPVPGLRLVAAVSAPLDIVRCSNLMEKLPFYNQYYVRSMVRQIHNNRRHFPHLPRLRFPRAMTLRMLDEIHTAPQGGFASAMDYYQQASSLPLVPRIQVPALLLTARDDPFISSQEYEDLKGLPNLKICIAPRGGHLGFLGWDGQGGIRWSEGQVVQWLVKNLWR
jgi:predicted alpha/beta-fold hydrolase